MAASNPDIRGERDTSSRRAALTGDTILLRAVGTVSTMRGWGRALSTPAQAAPDQAETIRKIQHLDDPRARRAQRWHDAIMFDMPRPRELDNVLDLRALVDWWGQGEAEPQRRADTEAAAFRNVLRR